MRTLAIDYGSRRIGLALSDEAGKFATPHDVLHVTSPQQALEKISSIARKEGVQRLVVGLPLNMNDTIGPSAKAVMQWASALLEVCPLPLIYVDERLSSFSAEQDLIDRKREGQKITRGQKKQMLDALAAAQFLQEFLDGKLPLIEVEHDGR